MAQPSLTYKISSKDSILILSVSGKLVRENSAIIEEAFKQLLEKEFTGIIFEISGVSEIDLFTLPLVSRVRGAVKDRKAEMKTCGMSDYIRAFLSDRGLLRPEHICKDIVESYKQLKASKNQAPST